MINQLKAKLENRQDLLKIADIIDQGASVLDLGSGEGVFLKLLRESRNIRGVGLEIDQQKIAACIENDVNVIQSDLNTGLHFGDKSFDFVVLSQTLQAVQRPDMLLMEMLRVGRKGVVSLINIGYLKSRLQLTFGGVMPKTRTLPYQWYNTPNIHLCTVLDFRNLCRELEIEIIREIPLGGYSPLMRLMPNLFAPLSLFIIQRNSDR
jgi:methionine biosynthesis protein MetW